MDLNSNEHSRGPELAGAPHLEESVLAMDGIPLELPVAGVGSRILAVALDYLALLVLWAIVVSVTVLITAGLLDLGGGWVAAAVLVTIFLAHWGYFAGAEILTRGRTLGKAAVRLRVVGREGGTPPTSAFLVRNILREVDLFVGLPLVASDALGRRLGDRAAGTLVVHDRPPEIEIALGRTPRGWGGREVALAESYLRRVPDLDADRSRELGWRLFALIQRDEPAFADDAAGISDPALAVSRALAVTERAVR